ncbi:hypothetical protein B0H14DRAFT_778003 [Mycena olivaceomarginata]|nr:hypothetical protein B0H14DRAFT_778003 [Mycena olivaceomarginata]
MHTAHGFLGLLLASEVIKCRPWWGTVLVVVRYDCSSRRVGCGSWKCSARARLVTGEVPSKKVWLASYTSVAL